MAEPCTGVFYVEELFFYSFYVDIVSQSFYYQIAFGQV